MLVPVTEMAPPLPVVWLVLEAEAAPVPMLWTEADSDVPLPLVMRLNPPPMSTAPADEIVTPPELPPMPLLLKPPDVIIPPPRVTPPTVVVMLTLPPAADAAPLALLPALEMPGPFVLPVTEAALSVISPPAVSRPAVPREMAPEPPFVLRVIAPPVLVEPPIARTNTSEAVVVTALLSVIVLPDMDAIVVPDGMPTPAIVWPVLNP